MERAGRLIAKLKPAHRHFSPAELAKAAWPAAVGLRAARHSRAVGICDGTLFVEVEDDIWRQNLEVLGGQILRNLAELLAEAAPGRIQYRLGIPRRPVKSEGLPEEFRLQARGGTEEGAGIEDPWLRRVYLRSKRKAQAS